MMIRLRELRKSKNLTQQALASKINFKQYLVSSIERGTRLADEQILSDIADYFHCSVDYLLGRSNMLRIADDYIEDKSKIEAIQLMEIYNTLPQENKVRISEYIKRLAEYTR